MTFSYLKANPNEKYYWNSIKVGKCHFSLSPKRPVTESIINSNALPLCPRVALEYLYVNIMLQTATQTVRTGMEIKPCPSLAFSPLIFFNRLGGIIDFIVNLPFPRHCAKYWDYNNSNCNICPQGTHRLSGKYTEKVKINHYYATEIT